MLKQHSATLDQAAHLDLSDRLLGRQSRTLAQAAALSLGYVHTHAAEARQGHFAGRPGGDTLDGRRFHAHVPEMIQVEVGTPVLVVDVGDGKPIVRWGS